MLDGNAMICQPKVKRHVHAAAIAVTQPFGTPVAMQRKQTFAHRILLHQAPGTQGPRAQQRICRIQQRRGRHREHFSHAHLPFIENNC